MRKLLLCGALASIMVFLLALRIPMQILIDPLQELGVAKAEAEESIGYNFINSSLSFYMTEQMKKMPQSRRAALVKMLGDYARAYVESPAFAARYKKERDEYLAAQIVPQGAKGLNKEQLIQKFLESLKNDEAQILEELETASGSKKLEDEAGLKQVREAMEALKDSKHPLHKKYFNLMKEELMPDQSEVVYEETLEAKAATATKAATAAKEAMKIKAAPQEEDPFPPTPHEMVKMRLKEFIEISATVDFDAKIEQRFNTAYFVDEKFEHNSRVWKAMYRCGKEVILPARTYAQQWLASLK